VLEGLVDQFAQGMQEDHEASFLFRLSRIIGGPLLFIDDTNGFGLRDGRLATISDGLPDNEALDGVDMLAFLPAHLKIRTGAGGGIV
jgi:hypothetical protein